MAETEKKLEAMEQEAVAEANAANPQASAPTKNAVAAEPMKKVGEAEDLGPAVVKPTDSNPDASKKVKQVSDKVSQSSQVAAEPTHLKTAKEETEKADEKEDSKKEAMHDKEDEKKKEMKAGYKEETEAEDSLDIKSDVDALIGDSDLSEEFKQKAATIFEAAIKSKVKAEAKRLEGEYETKLQENTESHKAEMVEKVDSYLNYVVEEWMKENQIAIERGIKGEIAEDFIGGLKKLFEDHYIDVPDEKYNVLEDQASKIEELEKKLNESIDKNVELNKANGELKRQDIIDETSEDLADTAKEKFNKLAEEVEYSNEDDFRTKVKTIKESYFGKKEVKQDNEIDNVAAGESAEQPADLSNAMAAYSAAISKTKDIKLSK
jgi:hypothetical protein|tara:strand:- start:422 stop:1555 length:1134 start_codon:yes stop_codon:yes gene_type:complete